MSNHGSENKDAVPAARSVSTPASLDAALRLSEERLRACIENTPCVAIQWFDRDGRVVYWNKASEDMFGWSREEAMGKTLDLLMHTPDETGAFLETLRKIEKTGMPIGPAEFNFIKRNKESGCCLSTLFSIPAPQGGQWFVCMDVDINDRKKAELALKESEELFRIAISTAKMGVWQWHVKTGAVIWSDDVEPILGLPHGSFKGTYESYIELIHPEDRAHFLNDIDTVLNGPDVEYENDHRVVGPGGSFVWIHAKGRLYRDEQGQPVRMVGTVLNVTDHFAREAMRKKADDELRVSEDRLRSLMRDSPIGTAIVAPDGRWLEVNPMMCEILGYAREELLTSSIQVVTHPEDLPGDMENVQRLLDGKITKYQMEKRYIHKNGKLIWAQLNVSLVRNADGTPRHFISHVQDITARRQMEEQYRQSQKMESIGLLAGGVAHDFNNIVGTIMMQAELAMNSGDLPQTLSDLLQDIIVSSRSAADLTRQLLLFSRKQVMHSKHLELNQLVNNLLKMLQRLVREDIHIRVNLHPEPLPIMADSGMIDQILLNLSVNARDAMPNGGDLTIETFMQLIQGNQLADAGLTPGKYAGIRVYDSGPGISADIMPHIFDPFFTTKEPGQGTGLGLATVFGIVKQHRGAIRASNRPGGGACFEILIPLLQHQAEGVDDSPVANIIPSGGKEKILLVEDNDDIRRLTCMILRREGYTIIEAESGIKALALIEKNAPFHVNMLITDLVMPGGVNGFELARHLDKTIQDIKVLFTSGYSEDLAGRELELEKQHYFLAKPYGARELLHTVRKCLDMA
ncbi:MAG TPA: PAS domain S-box protein [Kiritimatiellia bacterium]|nr:PAS domain S-box protein [Kiritimatiellia bacterium]